MKRVAVVVIVALLNAVAFGITGSAAEPKAIAEEAGQARPTEVYEQASKIAPGRVVHIVYLDGTETDVILESVGPDAIEILLVTRDSRVPATVPMATIRSIAEVKGKARRSSLQSLGIGFAVLTGLCGVLVALQPK